MYTLDDECCEEDELGTTLLDDDELNDGSELLDDVDELLDNDDDTLLTDDIEMLESEDDDEDGLIDDAGDIDDDDCDDGVTSAHSSSMTCVPHVSMYSNPSQPSTQLTNS